MKKEQKEEVKLDSKWTNDHMFPTYEEAIERLTKLNTIWTNDKQDHMQTKIRHRANGKFLVKYRKDPTFVKETKKNGRNNRKNKGNTKKGKVDTGTSV
jgi:hypothetical protein